MGCTVPLHQFFSRYVREVNLIPLVSKLRQIAVFQFLHARLIPPEFIETIRAENGAETFVRLMMAYASDSGRR